MMRFPTPILILSALISLSSAAKADLKAVTVRVEQETKEVASPKTYTYTQKRTLKVFVTNGTNGDVNAKIKYAFFGRGLSDHAIVIANQGEMPVTVKASTMQQVDTPAAISTYVLEHFVKGQPKKAPATGNKLVGYGVQIFVEDKMVAETYEPASMKEEMDKAVAVKPQPPKKG